MFKHDRHHVFLKGLKAIFVELSLHFIKNTEGVATLFFHHLYDQYP